MKILIIQTAFIGDVILATPVIRKLSATYPEATIDFLLRKGNESLLKNFPSLNEVIIWNKKKWKYFNFIKILKLIRKNQYDKVFNLQRYFSTGLFTVLSKSQQTIGFDKNPLSFFFTKKVKHQFGDGTHEVYRNLSLISKNISKDDLRPVLFPREDDFERVKSLKSEAYICISPTSVWFTKQFPSRKWIEFINEISEKFNIYLNGSKEDTAACEIIKAGTSNQKVKNLSGTLSLLETAALMQDAAMNYVNDSAPMHIASATNANVTAIFCSTIPDFGFGPLSKQSYVVETKQILDCRPCGIHGLKSCKTKSFECAFSIEKERLLNILKLV